MKKLLMILFLAAQSFGALNLMTWDGSASSDFNDTANWAGTVAAGNALGTGDSCLINTGSTAATASAAVSIGALVVTSGYTGNLSFSGQTLTTVNSCTIDNGGTLNMGNAFTMTGAGTLHINPSGAVTATACVITLGDASTDVIVMDDDKGITAKSLTVNGAITSSGAGTTTYSVSGTPLTLGASASLTLNASAIFICALDGGAFHSLGAGYTFNGSSTGIYWKVGSGGGTVSFPACTFTGAATAIFYFDGLGGTAAINLTGNYSTTGRTTWYNTAATTLTYGTGNYSITTAGTYFNFGCNGASKTLTANFGSSAVTCPSFSWYDVGTTNINFQTSQWTVSGGFEFRAAWNVDAGTSSVTATGTGASIFTSNSKNFYDITVNNASKAFSFADAASLHTLTTTAMASYTHTGTTLTASGNVALDGSGTLNLGNGVTLTGASSNFHIGSTLTAPTASSCVLSFTGTTNCVLDDDKGTTFKTYVHGAAAVLTSSGSALSQFTSSTTPLTITDGGTLTLNSMWYFNLVGVGATVSAWSITGSPTINGNSIINIIPLSNTITVLLPAITCSGTLGLICKLAGGVTNSIIQLSGNLVLSGPVVLFNSNGTAGSFNGQTFGITGTSFAYGGLNAGSTSVYNFGSGTYSFTSCTGSTHNTAGLTTANFNTSIWSCAGSWTFGSNHTVDPGASTVTFSGTAAQTITSNGKSFYDVTINRTTAGTCLFADATSLHTLTASATNTQAISWTGTTMTASGNITIDGTGTHVFGNGVTCTGASSNFHIGSTVGVTTATSCALQMSTTTAGVLDFDRTSITFKSLTLGAASLVTSDGDASTVFSTTAAPLTMGNGASLTMNTITSFRTSTAANMHSIGSGCTINGTATTIWQVTDAVVANFPAYTYTGSGTSLLYDLSPGGAWGINLTGTVSTGTAGFRLYNSGTEAATLDFNDQNITCGIIGVGNNNAGGTATVNCGSGIISVTSFDDLYTDPATINLESSTWNCSGDWVFFTGQTVDAGTAIVRMTPGAGATADVTSAAKAFNIFRVIGNATGTVALADALTCKKFTDSSGIFNSATFNIWADTIGIFSTAATTLSSSKVVYYNKELGTGATLTQTSTIDTAKGGTISQNAIAMPTVVTKGNYAWNGGGTIARLSFGIDGKKITFAGNTAYTLTAWDSSDFNGVAGSRDSIVSGTPGTRFRLVLPAADTLAHFYSKDCSTSVIVRVDSTGRTGGNNRNISYLRHLVATPATGPAAGATPFTVTGRGLIGGGALFGTEAATDWTVASNLSASGVSPAGSGTAVLRVYSSDCGYAGDTVTVAGGWVYISPISNRPQKNLDFSFGFEF